MPAIPVQLRSKTYGGLCGIWVLSASLLLLATPHLWRFLIRERQFALVGAASLTVVFVIWSVLKWARQTPRSWVLELMSFSLVVLLCVQIYAYTWVSTPSRQLEWGLKRAFLIQETPEAAIALGWTGGSGQSILINALNDKDEGVRRAAVSASGKIEDKEAAPALINALKDEYRLVRQAAGSALKKIGWNDPELIPLYIPLLEIAPKEAAELLTMILKASRNKD